MKKKKGLAPSLLSLSCPLLPFHLPPEDDPTRRPAPNARSLILEFLASRTVRNELLFIINYPV
jgi:hypothetical protein